MSRAVLAPFEAYQKARVTFVQTVAELAQRPQNIEALQSAGKSHTPRSESPVSLDSFLKTDSYLFLHELTDCSIFRRYGSLETPSSRQRSIHPAVSCFGSRKTRKLLWWARWGRRFQWNSATARLLALWIKRKFDLFFATFMCLIWIDLFSASTRKPLHMFWDL